MIDLLDTTGFLCSEEKTSYGKKQTITPYFYDAEKKIVLYNGDALNLLKRIPDKYIDLIFADPPYFGNQSGLLIKRNDGHAETFDTQKAQWAYSKSLNYQFEFHYTWLKEAQRILKEGSTIWVTGTYHSIGVINVVLHDLGFKLLNDIILHKRNAPPNFKGSCFRAVTETMLWAKKNPNGKTKFNYKIMKELNGGVQMKNIWEYWAEKNPFRHPATKQKIVLEYVLLSKDLNQIKKFFAFFISQNYSFTIIIRTSLTRTNIFFIICIAHEDYMNFFLFKHVIMKGVSSGGSWYMCKHIKRFTVRQYFYVYDI
ncbi:MAG: site-specific DNA-methyltransferase [Candidatus Omnitrophica bacterium]|nr:site-specific DNA-methyltransferase [Candidatus Omnitrophota bacterium]